MLTCVTLRQPALRREQAVQRQTAGQVEAVSPGIDLAVIQLEDESFFEKRPPLARTETFPEVKETVLVYGYPQGGSTLSITKGIVSRIEFAAYGENGLGRPRPGRCRHQSGQQRRPRPDRRQDGRSDLQQAHQADNIGYIIPSEEIDLFLKDIADGTYDGKPAMHESLQTLENDALRSFLAPRQEDPGHGRPSHRSRRSRRTR